jgi:hypothetical protein
MNNRILTIAAVLAASLIAGVFATTPMGTFADGDYDGDSSETNTEQSIKKKNLEAMDQPTSTVEITTLTAVLS